MCLVLADDLILAGAVFSAAFVVCLDRLFGLLSLSPMRSTEWLCFPQNFTGLAGPAPQALTERAAPLLHESLHSLMWVAS